MTSSRNWIENKFEGVREGTGNYIKWIEQMKLEIGSKGHAAVLDPAKSMQY
jgi:hypothetical protein